MKIIIIDDEPNMIFALSKLLSAFKDINVVATFNKTNEIMDYSYLNDVDLVFLDIEIGKSSDIELAKQLREKQRNIEIVFTTSHSSYAIEAYHVFAFDYIVKPITKRRLEQMLNRAHAKMQSKER